MATKTIANGLQKKHDFFKHMGPPCTDLMMIRSCIMLDSSELWLYVVTKKSSSEVGYSL